MPDRVQRKRTKGWQMPENTIYVGRPTRWGNPWQSARDGSYMAPDQSVHLYRQSWIKFIADEPDALPRLQRNLGGKNLACWCSLDAPCHADVLLELANSEPLPKTERSE